ncbi:hypothetical protein HYW87_04055 [Candidatus Roizmanbacteria bacterium]|nr:hypothetical protein [Candidatus Roizmanbacteria bacterium]
MFDDEIKAHIVEEKPFSEFRSLLARKNIKTMKDAALHKVRENVTTVEEVKRVFGPGLTSIATSLTN